MAARKSSRVTEERLLFLPFYRELRSSVLSHIPNDDHDGHAPASHVNNVDDSNLNQLPPVSQDIGDDGHRSPGRVISMFQDKEPNGIRSLSIALSERLPTTYLPPLYPPPHSVGSDHHAPQASTSQLPIVDPAPISSSQVQTNRNYPCLNEQRIHFNHLLSQLFYGQERSPYPTNRTKPEEGGQLHSPRDGYSHYHSR